MACSACYSHLIEDRILNIVDKSDFTSTGIMRSTSSEDLSVMRIEENPVQEIKLCNSPNLNYLNLLDYEDKQGDFQSSIFGCLSVAGERNTLENVFETFEEYTSASMFYFYVDHLRDIPADSLDLQAFSQRIGNTLGKLKNWESHMRFALLNEIIEVYCDLPSEKILLPIIMKHLCNSPDLITYAVRYCLSSCCNARFFDELLDASIKNRFNFWTMWERNQNLNSTSLCLVTYAYFQGKIDFLKVLLDYGFHRTQSSVLTLEILLDEHPRGFNFLSLQEILLNYNPRSRSALIDEVFLFVGVFLDSTAGRELLAKCFQLAWDARKEPYVTKREILDAIQNRFGRYLTKAEILLHKLWFEGRFAAFQTLLPGQQGLVAQPRSLRHLCRCTVRDALNDNWQMPRGVARLPVPQKLKSYILLK